MQNIYRVNADVIAKGWEVALKALKDAYKKTQRAVTTNPELQRLFNKVFVERITDWDTFVSGYFRTADDDAARAAWKREMNKMLNAKGYRRNAVDSFLQTVEANRDFLEDYLFLFEPEEDEGKKKSSRSKAR